MQIVGFTGTQRGINHSQIVSLEACLYFAFKEGAEFHHGDCIGADLEAAYLARRVGYYIVGHPGTDLHGKSPKRGWFYNDKTLDSKPYLVRNLEIVNVSNEMYATPYESIETLRSGTWTTIRMAKRCNIPIQVILP